MDDPLVVPGGPGFIEVRSEPSHHQIKSELPGVQIPNRQRGSVRLGLGFVEEHINRHERGLHEEPLSPKLE